MFDQIFLSPQVKQWAIINYEHGISELPHELQQDVRLKDLSRKILVVRRKTQGSITPRHIRRSGGKLPTQEKKKKKT